MKLKNIIQKFSISYKIHNLLSFNCVKNGRHNKKIIKKFVSLKRVSVYYIGKNNRLEIENGCVIHNTKIRFVGDNNQITFRSGVQITSADISAEGVGCKIEIGSNTCVTGPAKIMCGEQHNLLTIGDNNLIGFNTIIMTSDAHPIFQNNERINNPRDTHIGNNVWICSNVSIMKGTTIEDGAIIAHDSKIYGAKIKTRHLVCNDGNTVLKTDVIWKKDF